jgi:uncharacterized damage-inducible protein DinB
MSENNLIPEWRKFDDFGDTPIAPALDDSIDMSLPLKVYWMPGCSSCLRTKEFLAKRGVIFQAVNIVEDEAGFAELAKIGVKRIPIAARGRHWADGQVLEDLARIAGVELRHELRLSPAELVARGDRVMAAALDLVGRLPQAEYDAYLPGHTHTNKQLASHIFEIYRIFLEFIEEGRRFEFVAQLRDAPPGTEVPAAMQRFGRGVRERFAAWWQRAGSTADFAAKADVYYGDVNLHHFLERTIWHSAHHTRQLQRLIAGLGGSTEGGLTPSDLDGLPMPEQED